MAQRKEFSSKSSEESLAIKASASGMFRAEASFQQIVNIVASSMSQTAQVCITRLHITSMQTIINDNSQLEELAKQVSQHHSMKEAPSPGEVKMQLQQLLTQLDRTLAKAHTTDNQSISQHHHRAVI